MWNIVMIIAIGIIAAMAGYTVYLFNKLNKQKKAVQQAREIRVQRLKESIQIIARAMLSDECNLSEGVIRLKMLLEPLGQPKITAYAALNQLYQVVKDMPTHEARKALKKNERMRLDLDRESAEADLAQNIKQELHQLLADLNMS